MPPFLFKVIAVMGTLDGTRIAVKSVLSLLNDEFIGMFTIGKMAPVVSILLRRVVTLVTETTILNLPLLVPPEKVDVLLGAWRVDTMRILKGTLSPPSLAVVPLVAGRLSLEFTTTVIPPTPRLLGKTQSGAAPHHVASQQHTPL